MLTLLKTINDFLVNNGWILEITVISTLTIVIFLFWHKLQLKITEQAKKTEVKWDNILIQALSAPISLFIILMGMSQVAITLSSFLLEYYPNLIATLSSVRSVIILIISFWIFLRIINNFESHYRRKKITVGAKELHPGTLYAVFQSLRGIIFAVAVLAALEAFGVPISSLLALGGMGGIVIGFAAKDTLANFFSGLLIFLERPFIVGDWIRRPDAKIEGVVENIGWRTTQIRTFDQRPLYVPNSLFFNSVIENPQRMTNRRIYEYMGIRYQDIEKMPALLTDIRTFLNEHSGIAQDKIQMVYFDRYGNSSLDFFVYAMTKTIAWEEFHAVKEDVLLQIAKIVRQHGCDFAFPTRTLHHASTPPSVPMLPL